MSYDFNLLSTFDGTPPGQEYKQSKPDGATYDIPMEKWQPAIHGYRKITPNQLRNLHYGDYVRYIRTDGAKRMGGQFIEYFQAKSGSNVGKDHIMLIRDVSKKQGRFNKRMAIPVEIIREAYILNNPMQRPPQIVPPPLSQAPAPTPLPQITPSQLPQSTLLVGHDSAPLRQIYPDIKIDQMRQMELKIDRIDKNLAGLIKLLAATRTDQSKISAIVQNMYGMLHRSISR